MTATPLQWIEIAGARDAFPGDSSVLERARLDAGQPGAAMYRSEANLAEWTATAPLSALNDESVRIARLSIDSALAAARAARNTMRDGEREAHGALTAAALASDGARASRARLGIARYVAAIGAIRFAEDMASAAAGGDMPDEIAHAADAADAAASVAEALEIGMRIAAAEARSAERTSLPHCGIVLTDIPAVHQLLASLETRRRGAEEMNDLIARIETAAALAETAGTEREKGNG